MKTGQELVLKDISTEEGMLTTVDVNTLRPLPVEYDTRHWKVITEDQKQQFCCLLDDVNALLIPVPQSKEEEDEIVSRFLKAVEKLFT
ncbi:MAG: (Fe-S)-binding protein, partial [Mailhella sp.]|nr:(Fe-S)-binding protein [Mailhella sp.]